MSNADEDKLIVDPNELTQIVERYFEVSSITVGKPQFDYRIRYDGKLRTADSETAYDQLSADVAPIGLTPLFREEAGEQFVILVDSRPEAKIGPLWVNILLFVLTIFSVMLTGAQFNGLDDALSSFNSLGGLIRFVLSGWPFAAGLLGILLAHELGHYLVGRKRGAKVTLPYFIPFPFSAFGTMGAFISMKEIPKNKKHLLDIGIAGPLAGLLVAIPVLFIGLKLSSVSPMPSAMPEGYVQFIEGNSIFYLLSKYLVFGKLLPEPASFGNTAPVIYWLRYFFTGRPFPLGALDVQIHTVALAGWAGLFVTAINLIPAGQLDGGHILYVLLGRERAKRILPFILGALGLLGFAWNGWWIWAALIFFTGQRYAEPLDQITQVDRKHKILGMIALAIFILVFIPVPLMVIR